jgi:Protein of unknown function (DUF2380)
MDLFCCSKSPRRWQFLPLVAIRFDCAGVRSLSRRTAGSAYVGRYSRRSGCSQHRDIDRPCFRSVSVGLVFCALVAWPLPTQARGLRAAIFNFELIDTSLEGETNGPRADETARLMRLGEQLRALVAKSGRFEVINVAPVLDEARKENLQKCGGCDADFAQKLGAEISITGTVQKVSNLILNINLYARVVATKEPLVAMSVDIRGNTDESWCRGLEYLVRTRFLPSENHDPQ